MDSQEIFEKLMNYRNDSVRGDDMLDEYFDSILYSVAKVLGLSDEQAAALAGETMDAQPEPSVVLVASEYEITNGYVGQLGKTYKTATDETLVEAVEAAAVRNNQTVEDIKTLLLSGQPVAWCDSPNYYYDHGTGIIRRKRAAKPIETVLCDCGHRVPRQQVMTASLGTSCPDCYDRMSS